MRLDDRFLFKGVPVKEALEAGLLLVMDSLVRLTTVVGLKGATGKGLLGMNGRLT